MTEKFLNPAYLDDLYNLLTYEGHTVFDLEHGLSQTYPHTTLNIVEEALQALLNKGLISNIHDHWYPLIMIRKKKEQMASYIFGVDKILTKI
ncbi:MAG: hypothetical protein AAGM67_05240 [Bacteroidota bacterium]